MFGIKKVEVDGEKVNEFCRWFSENAPKIIESVKNCEKSQGDNDVMMRMLDEVELQLAKVYRDGYSGNIEFEYGYNPMIGKWDLNLYHCGNKFLKAATASIKLGLDGLVGDTWKINISK